MSETDPAATPSVSPAEPQGSDADRAGAPTSGAAPGPADASARPPSVRSSLIPPSEPPVLLPLPQADLRPMEQVLAVLDLHQIEKDLYEGYNLPGPAGRIYGGQVMAQSLLAAGRTGPEEMQRCPHSMHVYFLRMGRLDRPVRFRVDRLHDGGSFSARQVTALQDDVPILTCTASFHKQEESPEHQAEMPEVTPPERIPSNSELMKGISHPAAWMLVQLGAFDLRHVEGTVYFPNESVPSSRQAVWMRARTPLPDSTPQLLQRALLAYACDQVMLEPALRVHGARWSTPGIMLASLDHAMWFHRQVDVRDWILYVQDSPTTQGGRALGRASLFSRDGQLVASVAQEGLLRLPG